MRLLVVEDEKDLNSIIVKNLEAEGYIVDSCYDGDDAVFYMTTIQYDAVILDVMIPKRNGFEVLKTIREKKIETPVLFLTARDNVDDIVFGLNSGADDYMVKPFSFDELIARLRVIVRRKPEVRENIYTCGDLTLNVNTRQVTRQGKKISLSPKEYAILECLIRNKNIVLTRAQIESNIWDMDYNGESNVIDVYIRYLRRKIDDDFEEKLIHTVRGAWVYVKMQRVSKKMSIAKYISMHFLGITFATAVLMAVFITYFSDVAIDYDLKKQIRRESRYDYLNIGKVNGEVQVSDNFVYEDNEIIKVVLDAEGNLVAGSWPDVSLSELRPVMKIVREIDSGKVHYLVYDRSIVKRDETGRQQVIAYVRSMVDRAELSSGYRALKYASYICAGAIVVVSTILASIFSRHIVEPIKQICQTSEKIGLEQDLSQRIEYDGTFQEIEILAQANNRMLDRLEEMFERAEAVFLGCES